MADLAQLESAFLKADAAGDTEAATVLAAAVREARAAQSAQQAAPEVAPEPSGDGRQALDFVSTIARESGKSAADLVDFLGPGAVNSLLRVAGVNYQLPTLSDTGGRRTQGALEGAATIASGTVAEPVAGIAGAVQSLNPLAAPGAGVKAIEGTREALTYAPRTQEGVDSLQGVANTLKPVTDVLGAIDTASAEKGYELAGPVGAAVGATVPTIAAQLLSMGAGRVAGKAGRVASAAPGPDDAALIAAGKRFDVPLMTSDMRPPKGYAGRFIQSQSEKLGVLGTGSARASQQEARQAAIRGFVDEMDIDLDTPFAADMVKSLETKMAKEIDAAGAVRNRAVSSLDTFGPVPLAKTQAAVRREVARQQRLGKMGDPALAQRLQDALDSANGGNFSLVKDIRSELIDDLKAVGGAQKDSLPGRAAASVQSVKSAMDKDMIAFARTNDRNAAADWIRSNRAFAEAYTRAKDTELKRILTSGDITPEKIMPVIKGGRPSELVRLAKSMGEKGREAARKAIIQEALKDSKFFNVDVEPNPDLLANVLSRPNTQQAIRVFFHGDARKELDGLTRLLNATRRAQQGTAVVKTGEQAVPTLLAGMSGAAVYTKPEVAIPLLALGSAIIKSYESAPFRNLMLKLSNTQPGSAAELRILDRATASAAVGLTAARAPLEEAQEQEAE